MNMIKIEELIVELNGQKIIVDKDVAGLYGVETRDINKAVKNNPEKFPNGYMYEVSNQEFEYLRGKFSTAKFAKTRTNPKVFTEKGLYMLATILKSTKATQATLMIIETFSKIRELSRNINSIMKTTDEDLQKELANKSNKILEEIIEISPDVLEDDEGEIVETTTKFEFSLGFAKVSRSIKKIKK
ncbi:ORF6N domain-containing protein [Aliarcobacter butzleri]|uniref:ORF6N domain-containing protein n=1 Tax=Aliarcobacter butzleri TaxID=28197 RepID=UPI0021B1DCD7|nr:ORF6N domain-containing protein [Aliarcobacter butzleri]MCT7597611.1 ORF6N domain-containing protein [Aliarcobacter butzleri]